MGKDEPDHVTRRGDWFHYVRWVPERFRAVETDARGRSRRIVKRALKTKDPALARAKARALDAEFDAMWEARLAGRDADARRRYEAIRALADARGIVYRPLEDLLRDEPLEALVARVERLKAEGEARPGLVATAMLGLEPRPPRVLSEAIVEYLRITEDRRAGKSEAQAKRARRPKERAIENLVKAIGDKPLEHVTRSDALAFRDWLQARIAGGLAPGSANKDLIHVREIVNTLDERERIGLDDPFRGLLFHEIKAKRLPIPPDWVREKWLAPGALDPLNPEARASLLGLVNTGLRPAELLGAEARDIRLDANVPHIIVRSNAIRAIKTASSERAIPLVGISLEAMRGFPDGFPRYRGKAESWSAAIHKRLRAHGLLPSPAHTAYGLRHAMKDRLREVDAPEEIKDRIMGHGSPRPDYGAGFTLEALARWIGRVAV